MGNARNSHKNVARAGQVASQANSQPHGVPHKPQPWDAGKANRQAAQHNSDLAKVQKQADKGNR